MTKQEKIKGELISALRERQPSLASSYGDAVESDTMIEATVKIIMGIMAKNNAVIKVDGELPPQNRYCVLWDLYQKGWLEAQQAMRLDGYVKTIPLIEEKL